MAKKTVITPTTEDAELRGDVKRLKRLLRQYRQEFDDMTAAKRWELIKKTVMILVRVELQRARRDG